MKIVIVADWLTNMGGMEQVVTAMSDLYPDAPIFTSVYTPEGVPLLKGRNIQTTWLQRLPSPMRRLHQKLLPLLPVAMSSFDTSQFDVIISSSSAFAKCIKKKHKDQIHICYCHTPTRFLYHAREEYLLNYPLPFWLRPAKLLLPMLLDYLTKKDLNAAQQVDYFLANSEYVSKRIEKYYKQPSSVINPCVDTTRFKIKAIKGGYYLALGRFVPYKKFDLLVETFAKNGLPIKLAGEGVELARCKEIARSADGGAKNIQFIGYVEDDDMVDIYANAKAFLFPADEDFGLTPIEAMASGVPVIAYNKGGVKESVTDDTGLFFKHQTAESLQEAIDLFEQTQDDFDADKIKVHAAKFDNKVFQSKLEAFVGEVTLTKSKKVIHNKSL